MSAARVVLFDLGKVLVQYQPDRFWESLGIEGVAERERLSAALPPLIQAHERGELGTEEFLRALNEIVGGGHARSEIAAAYYSVLPAPVAGMEEVVRDVAGRCEVGLVSNTGPLHFAHCCKIIPALRHIRRFHLSYELGALKPDNEYFRKVVETEGLLPEELIFIDDLEENVAGAVRAGMRGLVFRDAEGLRKMLRSVGL